MTQAVMNTVISDASADSRLRRDVDLALAETGASSADTTLLRDVLQGLSQPQKYLPSKYFYDQRGSELFEEICKLPEYYPTRTEMAMLDGVATELKVRLPDVTEIVEFGSGNCTKVEKLLKRMGAVRRYLPIDVSETFLLHHCEGAGCPLPDS